MQDNLSKKLREELTRTGKIASYTDFEIEQAVEKYRSLNSPVSPTTSEARVELPELPETESNLNLLNSLGVGLYTAFDTGTFGIGGLLLDEEYLGLDLEADDPLTQTTRALGGLAGFVGAAPLKVARITSKGIVGLAKKTGRLKNTELTGAVAKKIKNETFDATGNIGLSKALSSQYKASAKNANIQWGTYRDKFVENTRTQLKNSLEGIDDLTSMQKADIFKLIDNNITSVPLQDLTEVMMTKMAGVSAGRILSADARQRIVANIVNDIVSFGFVDGVFEAVRASSSGYNAEDTPMQNFISAVDEFSGINVVGGIAAGAAFGGVAGMPASGMAKGVFKRDLVQSMRTLFGKKPYTNFNDDQLVSQANFFGNVLKRNDADDLVDLTVDGKTVEAISLSQSNLRNKLDSEFGAGQWNDALKEELGSQRSKLGRDLIRYTLRQEGINLYEQFPRMMIGGLAFNAHHFESIIQGNFNSDDILSTETAVNFLIGAYMERGARPRVEGDIDQPRINQLRENLLAANIDADRIGYMPFLSSDISRFENTDKIKEFDDINQELKNKFIISDNVEEVDFKLPEDAERASVEETPLFASYLAITPKKHSRSLENIPLSEAKEIEGMLKKLGVQTPEQLNNFIDEKLYDSTKEFEDIVDDVIVRTQQLDVDNELLLQFFKDGNSFIPSFVTIDNTLIQKAKNNEFTWLETDSFSDLNDAIAGFNAILKIKSETATDVNFNKADKDKTVTISSEQVLKNVYESVREGEERVQNEYSSRSGKQVPFSFLNSQSEYLPVLVNNKTIKLASIYEDIFKPTNQAVRKELAPLLKSTGILQSKEGQTELSIIDDINKITIDYGTDDIKYDRLAKDKRFLLKIHALQKFSLGYNETELVSNKEISSHSVDVLRDYLAKKGYKDGELPNFMHNIILGKILKRQANQMNLTTGDLEAILDLNTKAQNNFVKFSSKAVGNVGGLFLNKISTDSPIYNDNIADITEYNNEVDRIIRESKGFIKTSDPVIVHNQSTITTAKETLIDTSRNSSTTVEVVNAFLDALGNSKRNVDVRVKEYLDLDRIENAKKLQSWLIRAGVLKSNETKSSSMYKVDLKRLDSVLDDKSFDKFLNEASITDEFIDAKFEESRQEVADKLYESPDVAKYEKSITIDEFFDTYRFTENQKLDSQQSKVNYFTNKFYLDEGYTLDEQSFNSTLSDLYVKDSKDNFVKFTSLRGKIQKTRLEEFRKNVIGLLTDKSRQKEKLVIKFNNQEIVGDKQLIYSGSNSFDGLMDSLDAVYFIVNPISVGYRETGWGRYSRNVFTDGSDLPNNLRIENEAEQNSFISAIEQTKNATVFLISTNSDPIAVKNESLPNLHQPFIEFVQRIEKQKDLNKTVLNQMKEVSSKIEENASLTSQEYEGILRYLTLEKQFVGSEGYDSLISLFNGVDTEKLLSRFKLFNTKKFIRPNKEIINNAIFAYKYKSPDTKTLTTLEKYKRKNKYQVAVWDDENKNSVIDEAIQQAKRDNIDWNPENTVKDAYDNVSGYDSISYISKDMMRYLHTLIGHNPSSTNPIKPIVSSNGDSALLYGKTLFVYDIGMQKFFDRNPNVDILMSSSAVKITASKDDIIGNTIEDLQSGKVLLGQNDLKSISINSVGILPSKDVELPTASKSMSDNNFKDADEERLTYEREYLDDVNDAIDNMLDIYSDPIKQREFAVALDADLGTATTSEQNGAVSFLKSNHYYNSLTRNANPMYYGDKQLQNKLYSHFLDKIMNKKRAVFTNVSGESFRYGGQAYLVQTASNRLKGTLTNGVGEIIQRGEVILPSIEAESTLKDLHNDGNDGYDLSFTSNKGVDVFKFNDFIDEIVKLSQEKGKTQKAKQLTSSELKDFILERNLGEVHEILKDINKSFDKDYKIGVVVSRKPRTRPNDLAMLSLEGFMPKENGVAMQINSLDVVNVFEGDYDADKADYFFSNKEHNIDHVIEKQRFFVQGRDPDKLKKNKTTFSFTKSFSEQSNSMKSLVSGEYAWKNSIGSVQKLPRTLAYLDRLTTTSDVGFAPKDEKLNTLLQYGDEATITLDFKNLPFYARNALETQYMIDNNGNLNPELGADLLSIQSDLLFPTKDNSVLPNDFKGSQDIYKTGKTKTGKRIRIFRKWDKNGQEINLTELDKKIITTMMKEYSKLLNATGGLTYDNTGTQRKATYEDVLNTSKDFFEFHKDINRSIFDKLKKQFKTNDEFKKIFGVETKYRFKLGGITKYEFNEPKNVDENTKITSFQAPRKEIFHPDILNNAKQMHEGKRGATIDRILWEMQDRDVFNDIYEKGLTTGIPRRSFDDWYYKLTSEESEYDADLLKAEFDEYEEISSDLVINRIQEVESSKDFIKRNKYYIQRVKYNKALPWKAKKKRIDYFNNLIAREENKIQKYLSDTYLKTRAAKDLDSIELIPIDTKDLKIAGVQGSTMSAIKNIIGLGSDTSRILLSDKSASLLKDIVTIRKNFYSAHNNNLKEFLRSDKLLSSSTTRYLSEFKDQKTLHDAERELMIQGVVQDGIKFIYAYMDVPSTNNGVGVLNNKPVRLYNYPSTRFAGGLRFLSSYASGNLDIKDVYVQQSIEKQLSQKESEDVLKLMQGIISHYDNFYNTRVDRRGVIDKNSFTQGDIGAIESLKLPIVHDTIGQEVLNFGSINWGKTKDKISTGYNLTNNHLFDLYNDIMQLAGKTKEFEEYRNIIGERQADLLKANTINVFDFIGMKSEMDSEIKSIAQKVLSSSYFDEGVPDNNFVVERIKSNPVFKLMGGKSFFSNITLEKAPEQSIKSLQKLNSALDYAKHYQKPSHTGFSGFEKFKAKLAEIDERCS